MTDNKDIPTSPTDLVEELKSKITALEYQTKILSSELEGANARTEGANARAMHWAELAGKHQQNEMKALRGLKEANEELERSLKLITSMSEDEYPLPNFEKQQLESQVEELKEAEREATAKNPAMYKSGRAYERDQLMKIVQKYVDRETYKEIVKDCSNTDNK